MNRDMTVNEKQRKKLCQLLALTLFFRVYFPLANALSVDTHMLLSYFVFMKMANCAIKVCKIYRGRS